MYDRFTRVLHPYQHHRFAILFTITSCTLTQQCVCKHYHTRWVGQKQRHGFDSIIRQGVHSSMCMEAGSRFKQTRERGG